MTLLSNNWTLASFSLTVLSSPYWPWMPPLGFALVCPLFLLINVRFTHLRKWGGVVLACLVIITHSSLVKTQSSSIFKAGQDITIIGEVDSFFKQNSYGYEGSVAVYQINGVRLNLVATPKIRLMAPVSMDIGDEFQFKVKVKPVYGRLNDVGYDMESYYLSQGWVASASVTAGTPFTIVSKNNLRTVLYQTVSHATQDSEFQGMILALLFGERQGISQRQWQQLRDSGLAHLIAISGLHIGIAFGIGYGLGLGLSRFSAKWLWAPFVLGALGSLGYAWLAGFSLPTQRALIMCLLNVLMIVAAIKVSALQRILFTLTIILMVDPFASLASSFWLSFIAVSIVIYLVSSLYQGHIKWLRLIFGQFFLILLMAPVTVYFFGGVSWIAVFYNLIFIPWFSFVVVPILFLATFLSLCSLPFSEWIWNVVALTFEPLVWALQYASSGWILISDLILLVLLVFVLVWILRPLVSGYAIWLVGLILGGSLLTQTPVKRWRMDVLDVGHGLAIVLEKNGRFLLYDTGSSWENGSYIQSVVVPLLAKRGAQILDAVIYSHLDNDHAGGRDDVERYLQPKQVFASQTLFNSLPCIRGESWHWQGLHFSVLWPPKKVERAFNQHSCVIRVQDMVDRHSILLSGDVTAVGEWLLAREIPNLHSDVMIVPHHGSKTSSTQRFIERVAPDIAIASLAKGNRWNLPHPEIVARYQQQGVKWLDTGEAGQITLEYRAESRHLATLRQHGVIPWYRQMLRKEVE